MTKIEYPTKRDAMRAGEAAVMLGGTYSVLPVGKPDPKAPWTLEIDRCDLLAFARAFLSTQPGPYYQGFVSDAGLRAMAKQAVAHALNGHR